MATYKVIQDIEAEDKLLGPLSLRQFIYAGICALCLYLGFFSVTKHVPFLIVLFAPIAIFTGFFAFPWKLNQPTEIWALAKIRFLLKPRRRIWDQSGAKELVTITAPKRIETDYTNGLSQTEVKSRLKALADTIDSHGWAVKNVNVNLSPEQTSAFDQSSDRLVDLSTLPQEVSNVDVQASDDMLDAQSNPIAQQFDQMITASSQEHHQQIVDQLNNVQVEAMAGVKPKPIMVPPASAASQSDHWFAQQPSIQQSPPSLLDYSAQNLSSTALSDDNVSSPAEEASLSKRLSTQRHKPDITYSHMRTLSPTSGRVGRRKKTKGHAKATPMTQTPDPAILKLASNNDLNVATLARQANQKEPDVLPNEVIISLH